MRHSDRTLRAWRVALCGALVLLSSACAPRPSELKAIHQADPNVLAGQTHYGLKDIEYVDLIVDEVPESAYLAELGDVGRTDWKADKDWINSYFRSGLQERAIKEGIRVDPGNEDASFIISPTVSKIDTGYYRIPAYNAVSQVRVRVGILNSNGTEVEKLEAVHSIGFDAIAAPSTTARLQNIGEYLGNLTAAYLAGRMRGEMGDPN